MKAYTGCISDKGNFREKNQDRAVCHMRNKKGFFLAVACVCDGIGSFRESEIAAEMVTDGITRWFQGVKDYFPGAMDEKDVVADLEVTIRELNELVYEYRLNTGTDIGCTMSALLLVNCDYYVFHVGDSRICQVTDNLRQITRDEVSIGEKDGKVKPRLANYMGRARDLWLNRCNGLVKDRDLFILGSDGLFKKLMYEDVSELPRTVRSMRRARQACETLLLRVLERGERDNVSCILIYVPSAGE